MKQLPLIVMLILGTAPRASAFEGQGSNPGDWKMLPASLEKVGTQWNLRLRNLDLFPKYCSLRVTRQGEKLIQDQTLLFKADRSLSLPLGLAAEKDLSLAELETSMSCIKLADGEELDKVPNPSALSCDLDREDCEHICPAEANNPDRCDNEHLLLEFSRSSLKVEDTAKTVIAKAQLKSTSKETLSCQALITARVVGGAEGDASAVIAATGTFVLEPSQSTIQEWTFEKSEAGVGRYFDISRPRIAALCTPGKVAKDANWFKSCHPLKRAECNWVVAQD